MKFSPDILLNFSILKKKISFRKNEENLVAGPYSLQKDPNPKTNHSTEFPMRFSPVDTVENWNSSRKKFLVKILKNGPISFKMALIGLKVAEMNSPHPCHTTYRISVRRIIKNSPNCRKITHTIILLRMNLMWKIGHISPSAPRLTLKPQPKNSPSKKTPLPRSSGRNQKIGHISFKKAPLALKVAEMESPKIQ